MSQQCVPLRGSLPSRVDTSQITPVDVLPDDVLLELLCFCLDEDQDTMTRIEVYLWITTSSLFLPLFVHPKHCPHSPDFLASLAQNAAILILCAYTSNRAELAVT
jgi:hypothetical protein